MRGRLANPRLTFPVLVTGIVAYALLQSFVIPALPTLQAKLHTSETTVTWVLTAYLLSASVSTPILGRVGDMVGKHRMFVVTIGALAVGSLLAAVATSIGVMIVARVIQGIGGGCLPLAFGIVRDEFPSHKAPGAIGAIAALTGVGGGVGVVAGGFVSDMWGWRSLFWIPFVLSVLAAVAAALCIPASGVRAAGRINWAAAVALSGWLVAVLVAVSEGPTWGWASSSVIGLFVLAVLLALGWVAVELRSPAPLIDMRMMRRPAVWTSNLVALLSGVGLYAGFAFLPAFVQTSPQRYGYGFSSSVATSGLFLAPQAGGMFVAGIVSNRIAERVGARAVLIAGSVLSIPAFIILAAAHRHEWEVYLAMGCLGVGFGLAFAAMSVLVVQGVPANQTGVASGMNANIRTIGGSIGSAVMASIVASSAVDGVPRDSGYTYGFAALAVAAVGAALAALLVPRRPALLSDAARPRPAAYQAAPNTRT